MLFKTVNRAFLSVNKTRILSVRYNIVNAGRKLTEIYEKDGIRNIIMVDEKTRNSLSVEMMDNLLENITKDQNEKTLRCIVLSAKGKVFSAGHNLKELTQEKGPETHNLVFTKAADLMLSILKSPVPVIAKVDGLAAAAGCQLIATCDMVLCSDKSSFSTPGANFGIFCSTPGIAVGRVIPRMKASYMLLTGLPVSAEHAEKMGLITEVTSQENLDNRVDEICDAIKNKSRSVIALGKKFFNSQLNMDVKTAYDLGGQTMVGNLRMKDGIEGIQSFVEKRKANWSHE